MMGAARETEKNRKLEGVVDSGGDRKWWTKRMERDNKTREIQDMHMYNRSQGNVKKIK